MLATVAQVEAVLGRSLTAEETTRAEELIVMVQASIEGRLGRAAEGDTFTDRVYTVGVHRSRLLLDHFPVASVASVSEDGEGLTTTEHWAVDLRAGIITRIIGGMNSFWDPRLGAVVVTYTSETIAELSVLCAQVVARALNASIAGASVPAAMAGLRQLTVGRWSATKETGASTDSLAALALSGDELALVDTWRDRRS